MTVNLAEPHTHTLTRRVLVQLLAQLQAHAAISYITARHSVKRHLQRVNVQSNKKLNYSLWYENFFKIYISEEFVLKLSCAQTIRQVDTVTLQTAAQRGRSNIALQLIREVDSIKYILIQMRDKTTRGKFFKHIFVTKQSMCDTLTLYQPYRALTGDSKYKNLPRPPPPRRGPHHLQSQEKSSFSVVACAAEAAAEPWPSQACDTAQYSPSPRQAPS